MRGFDGTLAIERATEWIDHPPDQRLATGHAQQLPGAANLVSLFDVQILAEDDDTHRALFQIEDLAELPVGELHLLASHGIAQAIDPGNAIAHL